MRRKVFVRLRIFENPLQIDELEARQLKPFNFIQFDFPCRTLKQIKINHFENKISLNYINVCPIHLILQGIDMSRHLHIRAATAYLPPAARRRRHMSDLGSRYSGGSLP